MFSIKWSDHAFDQMQAIIRGEPVSKKWIAATLQLLTYVLRRDFDELGESRERGDRFWCVDPLAISFHIDPIRREIEIRSVKLM